MFIIQNKNKIFPKYLTLMLTLWLVFLFTFLPILRVLARTFDPNNIITDNELFNKDSLTKTAIQKFLERENSVLARYGQVVNGQDKTAAEIIYEISQLHNISPKFLLATLEKEKGLISKSQATEKELDWATGYSCHSGRCNEKYRGFYDQVESTAITQNIYKQKASQFGFRVGKTAKTYDGYYVKPANQATANLYIYTPYIGHAPELGINSRFGGNKLFWKIWNLYFTDRKLPDGLVMKYNGNYYLIAKNKKRKFISRDIFLKDYQESDAITVDKKIFDAYEDGTPIYFSNNTLVKSGSTGQAFLLLDDKKRPIIEESALAKLADFHLAIKTLSEIPAVDNLKLKDYPLGSPIDSNSVYPQGKLFKDETNQIYLVKDGLKHPINQTVWQINYKSQTPTLTTKTVLESYLTAAPIKFKDGTFVKSKSGKYYVISNGKKLKIKSADILKRVFGVAKFQTAILAPDDVLNLHENGLNIAYADDTIKDPPSSRITSSQTESQTSGTYAAKFENINPDSLIMLAGEIKNLTIKFKNIGSTTWLAGNVWLEVEGENERINFTETSVAPNQIATFNLNYQAPEKLGLNSQTFILYYTKNNITQKLASFGKFVLVKSGTTSKIISHDIPIAVRNNWRPVLVTMKIKNTSTDTTWLSRKTALEIYNQDDSQSPFYDKYDWIRKEVAAIPINKKYIKPGETGIFKFTIDPRRLPPGTYSMKFKLNLLDKNKKSLINGHEFWIRQIRVDG
jgi:hypothetical protein